MTIMWWGMQVAVWSIQWVRVVAMVVMVTFATTVTSSRVVSSTCLAGKVVYMAHRPVSYEPDALVIYTRLTSLSDGSVV